MAGGYDNVMRTRRTPSSSNLVPPKGPSTDLGIKHQAVLLHEAVSALAIEKGDIVVDATLGAAGHAEEIAKKLGPEGLFVGFDLDSDAIQRAQVSLAEATPRVLCIAANFRHLR